MNYLHERDKYRTAIGKLPCWAGANLSLHHRLLGRSNKIGDRVITQRIGLIKRWQWHASRNNNICAGCNSPIDGIAHPLRTCAHLDMVKAREDWWKDVDRLIMHSNRGVHELLFTLTRAMREAAGGEVACCGSFRTDFVSQLPTSSHLNDYQIKTITRVLKAVSGGARKILRIAAELQLGLTGVNWRQSTITQYYKPSRPAARACVAKRNWTDANSLPQGEVNKIDKNRKNHKVLQLNRD